VSRKRLDKPKFWIVAGPNGSGKSSIYTDTDIDDFGGSVWIINPDLLTARIQKIERLKPRAANIAAVTRIYSWLEASISAHQTIGVETVLSTEKYRELVLAAKDHGFEVRLIYILLNSPELSVERVKLRRPPCADHQNSSTQGALASTAAVVSQERGPCVDI
jgi:predicted ABC-type ATPase